MIAGVLLWADLVARSPGMPDAPAVHFAGVGPGEVAVVAIVFGTGTAILLPLIRRWSGDSNDGGRPIAPRDIEARLDRIEHAVEAIAEEVERISEGQRFVAQLMSNHNGRMLSQASDGADATQSRGQR